MPNLLDWIFYVTWINLLLMKHILINFNWIVNNLIVYNLLINYLNLKRVSTEATAHHCSVVVLKNQKQVFFKILQYSEENICIGALFLIKLQACNFPMKIAKFFKNRFFHKSPPVAACEKFINFPVKHQWQRGKRFIFSINTTE